MVNTAVGKLGLVESVLRLRLTLFLNVLLESPVAMLLSS